MKAIRWLACVLALAILALATIGLLGLRSAAPVAAGATLVVDDDGQGSAADCGATVGAYSTIQAAIDAAAADDTISVCPGTYNQDEANGRDPDTGGAGGNDFNIFVGKAVTIQGVNASGTPITNYNDVEAHVIAKRELPTFGQSAIFVQADGVTITGLEITGWSGTENNKTVEVVGDNVRIKDCALHGMDSAAALYFDDRHFDSGTNTSHLQSYDIEENLIDGGGIWPSGIRFSNGAGWSGDVSNRVIENNTFQDNMDAIAFVGPQADLWDVYPVGDATITGNSFSTSDRRHVIAWGEYPVGSGNPGYINLDWDGIVENNTFDKAAITWTSGGDARPWDAGSFKNVRGIYSAIQRYAIPKAVAGDTVQVLPGTYNETLKLDSTKASDLSVIGASAATTFITGGIRFEGDHSGLTVENFTITGDGRQRPALAEATVGTSAGAVLVSNARFANNVFDGEGITGVGGGRFGIYISSLGGSFTFENNEVKDYRGWGTLELNDTAHTVSSYTFTGNDVHDNSGSSALRGNPSDRTDTVTVTGNVFDNNGGGDSWASLEINEAETVTVSNNSITNTQMGSWGEGEALQFWHITSLTVTGNTIEDNYQGIYFPGVPYTSDLSGVEIHSNRISGNTQFGLQADAGNTGTADAEDNWWGSANGPTHASNTFNVGSQGDAVSDNVDFVPWLDAAPPGGVSFAPVTNSEGESYASIQAAVDGTNPGGTVSAATGVFSEDVSIGKSLTVQAASTPVIDCSGSGNGITLSANNVTIDGFEIRNCDNGVSGETSSSTISNNVIHDNLNNPGSAGVGILLWGDNDNNQISGNTVYNNDRQGIFIGHCDFAGPSYECTAGTLISSGNTISGNVIHDNGRYTQPNGPDESQYGIQLWNADGNTVSGNEIYNHSGWWFGQGVYLCQSSNNTVGPGNNLHNNTANVTIWGCDGTSSGNSVSGNTLANPGSSAINVFGNSPATTITGNTISATPTASASAIDAGDLTGSLTISGNAVSILGGFTGFYHAINIGGGGGGAVTISDNALSGKNVLGSNDVGIRLRASLPATTVVTITGNTISGFVNGIRADAIVAGATLTAHYNSLSGNSSNGVLNGAAPGAMIDAEDNWWGSASGPTHPSNTFNVGSQGVSVSDNVDFVPWLNGAPPGGASFAPVTTTSPPGSYASIQAGVDASNAGGTVNVKSGTYTEDVLVNAKNDLTIQGVGPPKPKVTVGPNTRAPVIHVKNSSNVTINGLEIDGAGNGASPCPPSGGPDTDQRFYGIRYSNSSGTVSDNDVHGIRYPTVCGSAVGIYAYQSGVQISGNTVYDFDKNGITANLTGSSTVEGNTVTGWGPTGAVAQNGIQVGFGATGTVEDNTVSSIAYTGDRWAASGILVTSYSAWGYPPSAADVTSNTVTDAQVGIYYGEASGEASGNTVSASAAGVGRPEFWGILVTDPPERVPSPFEEEAAPPAGGPRAAPMGAGVVTVVVSGNTLTGDGTADSVGLEADAGYGPENVNFTANDNTITNWGTGVVVAQCTEDCDTGVFVSVDVGPDNNVSAPTADPSNSGLHAMGSVNLNVHNNTFTGGYDAVKLRLSVTGTVKDNVVSGYAKNGITVGKAADDNTGTNVTVSGNTVTGGGPGQVNAQNGIQVGPNAFAKIENNAVSNHVYTLGPGACAGPGTKGDAAYYSACYTAAGVMVYQGTATVTGNIISGNQIGVDDSGAQIHYNIIRDNILYGVNNVSAGVANAEDNWWGSCSGPYHPTLNPLGLGDAVSDNVDFTPWITGPCDTDNDLLTDDAERLTWFTDWQNPDTDGDGCADGEEALYSEPALGGQRDPLDKWDFYDVPVPAIYKVCSSPGVCSPVPTKDRVAGGITTDLQALLKYAGAKDTGSDPRYNVDLDGNTIEDGLEYDRTLSAYPGQPWRSGPPDGTAGGITTDVQAMLKQAGHSCAAPP